MAKSYQSLRFICRRCQQSILPSTPQLRSFSNSVSRSNTIPKFQPTSLPELDELLLDWRRRVFTPAALNTTHQALVYKKSRHAILENDPGVTVTMSDGEDVKLEPMDAFDKPNKLDSLAQLVRILSSTRDTDAWSQLPAFLEGMTLAKERIPLGFLEKLTRKANENGKAGVIKQCAARGKKTVLRLNLKPVTRELFLGCHERFVEAMLLGEDFEKEHKFAESLALMMESQDHCAGSLRESAVRADMRRDLVVVGVLLELAAARAVHVHQGKDIEGSTGSFAQKLIALAGDDILRRHEKEGPGQAVEQWIPIASGIRLALKVNGLVVGQGRDAEKELKQDMRGWLSQLDTAIEEESAKIRADAKGKPRRALIMLENIKHIS